MFSLSQSTSHKSSTSSKRSKNVNKSRVSCVTDCIFSERTQENGNPHSPKMKKPPRHLVCGVSNQTAPRHSTHRIAPVPLRARTASVEAFGSGRREASLTAEVVEAAAEAAVEAAAAAAAVPFESFFGVAIAKTFLREAVCGCSARNSVDG
jgi:hypothetical protein